MVNLTKYGLKPISGNRDIENYKNMSRNKLLRALNKSDCNFKNKLLRALNKSDCNFKNISLKGLEKIAKMQNLSQNGLKQIKRMKNLLQDELEKIAVMKRIKNYKNMSREKLLTALLKSEQSHAELYKNKSNKAETGKTRKIFNEIRNKLLKSKTEEIRKYLYEREKGLKSENEKEKKRHTQKLKKIKIFLEGLREEAKKNINQ